MFTMGLTCSWIKDKWIIILLPFQIKSLFPWLLFEILESIICLFLKMSYTCIFFNQNPIFVSALTKDQRLMIRFICHHALIQDMRGMKMIGKADFYQQLYVLGDRRTSKNARINVVYPDVWHSRLDHPLSKCLFPIKNSYMLSQLYQIFFSLIVLYVH